jgi:hypothetical protein
VQAYVLVCFRALCEEYMLGLLLILISKFWGSWDVDCNIESRTGHGRIATNSEGEYMGSIAHEEAIKFSHNNQELGGLTLQRQRLDTSSMCLLVICYLATLLFREVNVMHTHIELIVDVIRGTRGPNWLNLLFNGPRFTKILNSHDAKITTAPV